MDWTCTFLREQIPGLHPLANSLQSAPLFGSDAIGHPKDAAFREHTKGWFAFDTVRRMADERVHPRPSLHRLLLSPDGELDFSVNGQTPCL
jgi:hypothetical protein